MRILVTGCGGMLGEAVYSELVAGKHSVFATDIDVNEDWINYLDVRHPDQVDKVFRKVRPNAVIHLAALTDMEYCQLNPVHAYDVNFVGTYNVMRTTAIGEVPFVYISSAGVFNGEKQTYVEGDTPNPVNVYAKSKFAGELVALSYRNAIVVRAGWMMGGGPQKDKKFVNKIIKQIRAGSKELFIVKDKLGTPTYTYELAKTIHRLLTSNCFGLYHGACDGGGSRVDVAREIVKGLGLQLKVSVNAVGSDYFSREYFVKRPPSEKLISSKLEQPPSWQSCLSEYLSRFEWKVG